MLWTNLITSVMGLVIGFLLGVLYSTWREKHEKGSDFPRIVGLIVLLLAVASAAQVVYFQESSNSAAACQYRVNRTLVDTLNVRSELAEDQDQQLSELVRSVLGSRSSEQTRKSLQDYLDANEKLQKSRNSGPLPVVPEECYGRIVER